MVKLEVTRILDLKVAKLLNLRVIIVMGIKDISSNAAAWTLITQIYGIMNTLIK